MKMTILGTGNALATECYNTCFVISEENQHFLVDGGGGSTLLRQLKYAGLKWQDIKEIFVTHKHMDHLLGILWMVRLICQNLNRNQYTGEVKIYAHDEVIMRIKEMAAYLLEEKETRFIGDKLHLIVIHDGEQRNIIGRQVTFFDIRSTKAKQYGFSMDLGDGKKLTCCGDEPYNDCEQKYVENSTWLLHEAFCLFSQADIFKPYEKHHSTVRDACELAQRMNVKNLILYHTEDTNIAERKKLYNNEGKIYFRGNLYIPDDLETYSLLEN